MNPFLTIGDLQLTFEALKYSFPKSPELRDPVAVHARVKTPFSEASAEGLCLPFAELILFRNRLRKFLRREDEGVAALSVLMPSFDLIFIARTGDRVMADIRLSPDLRLERHMYDFEFTWNEIADIAAQFEMLLVSLPLQRGA